MLKELSHITYSTVHFWLVKVVEKSWLTDPLKLKVSLAFSHCKQYVYFLTKKTTPIQHVTSHLYQVFLASIHYILRSKTVDHVTCMKNYQQKYHTEK